MTINLAVAEVLSPNKPNLDMTLAVAEFGEFCWEFWVEVLRLMGI